MIGQALSTGGAAKCGERPAAWREDASVLICCGCAPSLAQHGRAGRRARPPAFQLERGDRPAGLLPLCRRV